MKTILTLINKDTRAPRTVSGLHAALTEPCVVQLSVDSVHDIALAGGGERQAPGPRHGARASAVPAVA